jgi:type II secretory pathway component PulF
VKDLCLYAKTQIEKGRNLASTSRDMPGVFNQFDSAMFEMGDATGKIGYIFTTLMEKEEKMLEIERKVIGALIYPVAVIGVAVLMVVGLLIFVIPRIESIYAEAHTALPPLTQGVLSFSHFLQKYGIWVGFGVAGMVFCGQILLRQKSFRLFFDTNILRIPIFGKLIRYKILVIFSDFLSLLLQS